MSLKEDIIKEKIKLEDNWMKPQSFKRYGQYYIPENIVRDSTVVYSFGVHTDVRFEQALCTDNSNIQIKCYDPTPSTVDFFKEDFQYKDKMTYYPLAYAEKNGQMKFYYDRHHPEKCYSLIPYWEDSLYISVNTTNLKSIYDKYGPADIIKADIEGVWKPLCREILDHKLDFKVLAIEFDGLAHRDALEDMKILLEEFAANNYEIYINRRRNKGLSEAIIIKNYLSQ